MVGVASGKICACSLAVSLFLLGNLFPSYLMGSVVCIVKRSVVLREAGGEVDCLMTGWLDAQTLCTS